MSHKATNWAIEQRGLKPSARVVLWHLADRHNPDNGCFPSQDLLASDCEMSRSNVNVQLNTLEKAGLIKRIVLVNPKTRRQMPTRYLFAFEASFAQAEMPCPESGHGAVSSIQAEPCPENEESRVQNLDTNLVREPLKKPCVAKADFELFWKAHPRPKNRERCLEAFMLAVEGGVDPARIVDAARKYAVENEGNKSMYVCQSDNWLLQKRWKTVDAQEIEIDVTATPEEKQALFWAGIINDKRPVAATAFKPHIARLMVQLGLVSTEQLRSVGMAP